VSPSSNLPPFSPFSFRSFLSLCPLSIFPFHFLFLHLLLVLILHINLCTALLSFHINAYFFPFPYCTYFYTLRFIPIQRTFRILDVLFLRIYLHLFFIFRPPFPLCNLLLPWGWLLLPPRVANASTHVLPAGLLPCLFRSVLVCKKTLYCFKLCNNTSLSITYLTFVQSEHPQIENFKGFSPFMLH